MLQNVLEMPADSFRSSPLAQMDPDCRALRPREPSRDTECVDLEVAYGVRMRSALLFVAVQHHLARYVRWEVALLI